MKDKKENTHLKIISRNKKAQHDYTIENQFEAGIVLEGWEVKSIRAGRVQLKESHILIRHGEAWLINTHITPLNSASTHIKPDPRRSRKLLLHRRELGKLTGSVERKGYTVVPLTMYWKSTHVKLKIALARGKKLYDKRASEKARDWQRQKHRFLSDKRGTTPR